MRQWRSMLLTLWLKRTRNRRWCDTQRYFFCLREYKNIYCFLYGNWDDAPEAFAAVLLLLHFKEEFPRPCCTSGTREQGTCARAKAAPATTVVGAPRCVFLGRHQFSQHLLMVITSVFVVAVLCVWKICRFCILLFVLWCDQPKISSPICAAHAWSTGGLEKGTHRQYRSRAEL